MKKLFSLSPLAFTGLFLNPNIRRILAITGFFTLSFSLSNAQSLTRGQLDTLVRNNIYTNGTHKISGHVLQNVQMAQDSSLVNWHDTTSKIATLHYVAAHAGGVDTAIIPGTGIGVTRTAHAITVSNTSPDTAIVAGTGINITRSAGYNTISANGGYSSVQDVSLITCGGSNITSNGSTFLIINSWCWALGTNTITLPAAPVNGQLFTVVLNSMVVGVGAPMPPPLIYNGGSINIGSLCIGCGSCYGCTPPLFGPPFHYSQSFIYDASQVMWILYANN